MSKIETLQVNDEGYITLQYRVDDEHCYYSVSDKPISMKFRDYTDISIIGAIDFYDISEEEQQYIEKHTANQMKVLYVE